MTNLDSSQKETAGGPWYESQKQRSPWSTRRLFERLKLGLDDSESEESLVAWVTRTINGTAAVMLSLCSGLLIGVTLSRSEGLSQEWVWYLGSAALAVLALLFLVRQMGSTAKRMSSTQNSTPSLKLGFQVAKGSVSAKDARRGIPAPELALQQFVAQVKAYAQEKSYQRTRSSQKHEDETRKVHMLAEPVDLLKRRWNEVLDSLNEFEIYLAGDPKATIEKLLSQSPSAPIDVSQVFRDVAETFDTTWRRKGINIESAIVTPLKATTHEAILRRILVGPWRASAYFARRGSGVVFSAKSENGVVVARWECEGLAIPEDYLEVALDSNRPVNERIELGMEVLAPDPHSASTLFALISLITWIDLAKACEIDYQFKHTNDGFVTQLRLR